MKSWEATQFGQGLLTYALLQGMQGPALREGEYADVSGLAQYAQRTVEELAGAIGGIQRPVLAVPWAAQSFPVGRLLEADRKAIPLARARPRILRPMLLNPAKLSDDLHLSPLIRKKLQEESLAATRGGPTAAAAPVFVDADPEELPGALSPSGIYTVEGETVRWELVRKDGDREVARLRVEGRTGDLPGVAARVVEEIMRAAGK